MPNNTYYVQAKIDVSGRYAACSYFTDAAGTQAAPKPLTVSQSSGDCLIGPTTNSELALLGAVYKTLGNPPKLNGNNFAAADGRGMVRINMPTSTVVTKGVVLLFSKPSSVDALYPSADPEVKNDDQ